MKPLKSIYERSDVLVDLLAKGVLQEDVQHGKLIPSDGKNIEKIGKLTVLHKVKTNAGFYVQCRCECGEVVKIIGSRWGKQKSCGHEKCKPRWIKHGLKNKYPIEYYTWKSIRQRCRKGHRKERRYFLRGISICERWNDFLKFMEDMGKRPCECNSIDRINNDLGYYPANCRWANLKQQARNREDNRMFEYQGDLICMAELCEKLKINEASFRSRIERGWTFNDAIEKPYNEYHKNRS